METRKLEVGHGCIYHDDHNRPLPALVTAIHGEFGGDYVPTINVIFVSPDPKRQDGCGRQTEHASSVTHRSSPGLTAGNYWRHEDEEPVTRKPTQS